MTEGMAIEVAKHQMRDMNVGCKYLLRFRHLILKPGETRILESASELILLISPVSNIRVQSSAGFYELTNTPNELQYVHSGRVQIVNLEAKLFTHVKILHVIPRISNT